MPGVNTIATYTAEQILKNVEENAVIKITINKKVMRIRLGSVRLRTFKEKGTTCVCCGREGTLMGLDLPIGQTRPHFNLYCVEDNTRILMTKDHIVPKSRGGKNRISNMQTMCCRCNSRKGDKTPEEYDIYMEK